MNSSSAEIPAGRMPWQGQLPLLLATLQNDLRSQWRNGFYIVSLVVIILWVILLGLLPDSSRIYSLPVAVLNNLTITAYFFVAALILFEINSRTPQAQAITPLMEMTILASKCITLSFLGWLEGLVISLFLSGSQFHLLWYTLAIWIAGFQYVLLGVILVARYSSINQFIIPGGLFIAPLSLPLLPYYGIWESPAWILHPMGSVMYLLRESYGLTAQHWEIGLSLISAVLWIVFFFRLARRRYRRMILHGDPS